MHILNVAIVLISFIFTGGYGVYTSGSSYGGNGNSYGVNTRSPYQGNPEYQHENKPDIVYINKVLRPTIVNEPVKPPITVNEGHPPFVVKQNPVVFKQPRGQVVQQHLIHRQGEPINYNPIFVKVFDGKRAPLVGPIGPASHYPTASEYGSGYNSYGSSANY